MLSRLSISGRLWATMAVLAVLIIVVGVLGQLGMKRSNDALSYAYSNQLAASMAVGQANLELEIARVILDRSLIHPDAPNQQDSIAKALSHLSNSDRAWHSFREIKAAPEEQVLADRADEARTALVQRGIVQLANALKQGDRETADRVATKTMSPLALALSNDTDALDHWRN
ncbi:MAG TPA: Tar ligand binding domain-containing protein, partial [Gemmatimonadaceae bacterium]